MKIENYNDGTHYGNFNDGGEKKRKVSASKAVLKSRSFAGVHTKSFRPVIPELRGGNKIDFVIPFEPSHHPSSKMMGKMNSNHMMPPQYVPHHPPAFMRPNGYPADHCPSFYKPQFQGPFSNICQTACSRKLENLPKVVQIKHNSMPVNLQEVQYHPQMMRGPHFPQMGIPCQICDQNRCKFLLIFRSLYSQPG